jgi:hypothetical protein
MKCPIVEQGKIVGFYLKETPAETAAPLHHKVSRATEARVTSH